MNVNDFEKEQLKLLILSKFSQNCLHCGERILYGSKCIRCERKLEEKMKEIIGVETSITYLETKKGENMEVRKKLNENGLELVKFFDKNLNACSLEKSVNREERCVYLGLDEDEFRMYLSIDQVQKIVDMLKYWIEYNSFLEKEKDKQPSANWSSTFRLSEKNKHSIEKINAHVDEFESLSEQLAFKDANGNELFMFTQKGDEFLRISPPKDFNIAFSKLQVEKLIEILKNWNKKGRLCFNETKEKPKYNYKNDFKNVDGCDIIFLETPTREMVDFLDQNIKFSSGKIIPIPKNEVFEFRGKYYVLLKKGEMSCLNLK